MSVNKTYTPVIICTFTAVCFVGVLLRLDQKNLRPPSPSLARSTRHWGALVRVNNSTRLLLHRP